MEHNLKEKAISGVVWTGLQKFGTVLLNFVSGIVLARLLTPHDYGIVGMLTIFLAISNTFIEGGFGSALIQKQRPTNVDYSTILYWNVGFSLLLYGILFVTAPLIARFYNLPLLTIVLRVQAVVLIINSARIVQRSKLRKELQFKKVAIINFLANLLALVFTIILAWKGFGVWALVFQQIFLSFLTTTFYWVVSKWKPILVFSRKSFHELFSFGGFILLSNLFNTLCNNIQGLLIGKVYSSSTLGLYTKAQRTEQISSTLISSILDQVSYPVLSELQKDRERMIKVLGSFVCTAAYLTFPFLLLLVLLAKPIFIILYSERWLSSVPYFQVLCIAGIAMCLQTINYYAVAAVGESKELLKWTIVKRSVGLAFVVLGMWFFGIYGLLVGMVITSWLIYIINAKVASKYVGYTLKRQFLDLAPIFILSIFSFGVSFSLRWLSIENMYLDAFAKLFLFILTYISVSFFFQMNALSTTKSSLFLFINKIIAVR